MQWRCVGTRWGHRQLLLASGAFAAGVVGTTPAHAGTSGASASAVALKPLSLVKLGDLDFGTNIVGASAGTVVIDPDTDARSTSGSVLAAGGAPAAAKFYSYGRASLIVSVTRGPLPTLSRSGGGASMNVTQLTLNGPTLRLLDAGGLLDLRVGGTLAVGANQMQGSYSGNFDITVTYF